MKMHHPLLIIASVSIGGRSYTADERGVFDVPDEAAADLAAHGLVPGEPKVPEPKASGKPVSQWSNADLKAKAEELGLELPEDIKRPDLIQAVTDALKASEGHE